MTVERETTRGRFLCICPPKELHGGIRRGHEEQVRAQIADNGFGVDSQIFLGDGGGLAIYRCYLWVKAVMSCSKRIYPGWC